MRKRCVLLASGCNFMENPGMNVTSKIQYNTFEAGEFTDVQKIDFDTAIRIIETFPWKAQRNDINIDLTAPSVSFEYSPDSILKLALYFNNKWVLNFFDGKDLFSKSFIDYKSAYPFLQYFFEHKTIDYTVFKKENTWLKKIDHHFRSNNFIYSVNGKNAWQLFNSSTKMYFLMSTVSIGIMILFFPFNTISIFISLILLTVPAGINYLLTFNYYLYSKDKILQLSQGSDTFFWGNRDELIEYRKFEIAEIIIRKNKSFRCPWGDFTLTYLYFKNGDVIKIPSILLDGLNIHFKIPGTPWKEKSTFIPFSHNSKLQVVVKPHFRNVKDFRK